MQDDETDGKCFFRVLYVEGGNKSTMFRCKTPIYSSDVAEDCQFPQVPPCRHLILMLMMMFFLC